MSERPQLSTQVCETCRSDSPQVSAEEINQWLPQIAEWEVVVVDAMQHLVRIYTFANFVEALEFTQKVGDIAEAVNHHPRLVTEWGEVRVEWWTHSIQGLHKNDFIMAARTDRLLD